MWIFNVNLQQESVDGKTRKLEPAAVVFFLLLFFLGYTTVYPEDALTVVQQSLQPVGMQQRVSNVCTRQGPVSERKRLTMQPLSLAKQKRKGMEV